MKKTKNKYDPKIETVKYLELIDKNKIWLIFNTASKVCKFPGRASTVRLKTIANDFRVNPATQVILKFMRDPGLILAENEHWRGIDAACVVPIKGVVLGENIRKLKYDDPILVEKR